MKRAAFWLRTASRRASAPNSVATGAACGCPSPATTCASRCHNTAAEAATPSRPTAPHGFGASAQRSPIPPIAPGFPPCGCGSRAAGGIPRSSGSSTGGRQGGQTFTSRLIPENPFLLSGLTGAAFCAGLSLGHMSQANGMFQNLVGEWQLPTWPGFEAHAQAPSSHPSPAGPLSPYFIADAAAKAAPAVVNITVQTNGFPFYSAHSGSGFIVDPDGTILTNAHVIAEALPRELGGPAPECPIICTLPDGRIFEGTLAGYDRVSDLAVVRVQCEAPLPSVRLGSSSRLRPGEWVVALGSPLHLSNSITAGIVSSVERKAVELGLASAGTDYIQTDAAINQGNSGGPLVNLEGEVVAICNMKALAADGVSFAIPIDAAKEVVAALAAHGRVIRPYIGIKMLQLTPAVSAQLRRRDPRFPEVDSGILVPHVNPGSPAERAGMKPGDVIIGVDDASDVTTAQLSGMLAERINKPISLKVLRHSGEQHTLQLRLLEQYSELVAPEQALAYQACYKAAVSNEHREVLDDCSAQEAAMKKALTRLQLYPFVK